MEPPVLTLIVTLAVTLGFGIYFSYTDIAKRTILNKPLLVFLVFGITINILAIQAEPRAIMDILPAMAVAVAIGLASYYFNIWQAGDGKLFIVTTFAIIPFAYKPFMLIILNFALPVAFCYCLLFPVRLVDAVAKRKIMVIVAKTNRAFFSLERLCQVLFTYSFSAIIPLRTDITIRVITIYLAFYLIQNQFKGYFTGRIKIWHLYAVISLGLLLFVKITGSYLPPINLLLLFGGIFIITFYFSMDFFSRVTFLLPDALKPGMELAYSLYKRNDKIMGDMVDRTDAELFIKAPKQLNEADINFLKEGVEKYRKIRIPIQRALPPAPFAPFIMASSLVILGEILWHHFK